MNSLRTARSTLNEVLLDKSRQVDLCLAALLARGHVLLDDVPGVGKTTLALALAKVTGLGFKRLQFTNDLLPADVCGYGMVEDGKWTFREGPVFTDILLADEINRASPHSQSSLLEAMEERQVTVDRHTRKLPESFFVIATQNPGDQIGTNPLPESQIDRFMFSFSLGYPSRKAEMELLAGGGRRAMIDQVPASFAAGEIVKLQAAVDLVVVKPAILEYLMRLIEASRNHNARRAGLSPRAGIALRRACQAIAMVNGRDYVTPDDVRVAFPPLASHRLGGDTGESPSTKILESVPLP